MIGVQEILAEAVGALVVRRRAVGAVNADELDAFGAWLRRRPINDPTIEELSYTTPTQARRPWPTVSTVEVVATLRFDGSEEQYERALRQILAMEIGEKIDAEAPR